MKIAGVTLCFNESQMVKYVMPYWERIGIDKLIVYDNMSSDNSVELLSKYDFVEVRQFDTNGGFNDKRHVEIKQDAIQELKDEGYDWIYCGDFDEVLYCENPNFREELEKIEALGGTAFCRNMIVPFSTKNIIFDPNKLIHEQMNNYLTWYDQTNTWGGSKILLINPRQIPKIKYTLGAHKSSFPGKNCNPVLFGYPFMAFHLKFVDTAVLEDKSKDNYDRMIYALEEANARPFAKDFCGRCYLRTIGDKLQKYIKKLINKAEKVGGGSWDNLMARYNSSDYFVCKQIYGNNPKIKFLDYSDKVY